MHPVTREDAKQLRKARYDSGENCQVCYGTPLRFTHNGKCVHCCRLTAIAAYNEHEGERAPVNLETAKMLGVDYYYTPDMCGKAGHVGVKNLNHQCVECVAAGAKQSPRQVALKAGARWYIPETPCSHCGTQAERYVATGLCRGCVPLKDPKFDGRMTAETRLIKEYPNMTITRKHADMLGLTVYRTGEPCSKKHRGWRYVSNGGCLSCR